MTGCTVAGNAATARSCNPATTCTVVQTWIYWHIWFSQATLSPCSRYWIETTGRASGEVAQLCSGRSPRDPKVRRWKMLTREQNERLTRVGAGTPMGELLRRYWHPVAAVSEFGKFPLPRKLMGEEILVYRDLDGNFGAIEPRCPHRGASLALACVENGGIRCAYHGWKYDHSGQCVSQPPEAGGGKSSIKAKAYPAAELGGLVWLYMGPLPAPLVPRYDIFVWQDCLREIGQAVLNCNFAQTMENSVDPHHVEWLHGKYGNFIRGDEATSLFVQHAVKTGFDLFEYGIIKRRLVEGQTEESDSWKIGHPLVFPTMLRVGGGGHNQMQIRVPVDDYTTHHYYYTADRPSGDRKWPPQESIPLYDIPLYR